MMFLLASIGAAVVGAWIVRALIQWSDLRSLQRSFDSLIARRDELRARGITSGAEIDELDDAIDRNIEQTGRIEARAVGPFDRDRDPED